MNNGNERFKWHLRHHSVNGSTGDVSIAGMWKNSFEALYNMNNTTDYHLFNDANVYNFVNGNVHEICTRDLLTALQNMKLNKACGPDGIPAEAIKYGGQALVVHLSFLFSMFLSHSCLPTELIQTTLVPLLKNKAGNISDVNNYRAIALSNSISKLLEDVLLQSIKQYDTFDDMHQFGFKKQHFTYFLLLTVQYIVLYCLAMGLDA